MLHAKKSPLNAAICSILQYLHCVPTLQQHTMERPPEDKKRYARFVAAFAAFVLLFWSGGGRVGGGLIAPCLLFQLLANDVHACVCVYIYIYIYLYV